MSLQVSLYLWFVAASGGYLGYLNFPEANFFSENLSTIIILAFFAFLAEIYEIEILPQQEISVASALYLSAIFIGGVELGIVVALPAIFVSELLIRSIGSDLSDGQSVLDILERLSFNTAQLLISLIAAATVYHLVGGSRPPFLGIYDYIPPLVAFFVFVFINLSLVSGIISLSQGKSFPYQLKYNLKKLRAQVLTIWAVSILIAVVYETSVWNVVLIGIVLFLIHSSLKSYVKLRRQAKNTFEKVMDLLEKRDPYTRDHSESVGDLTKAIAGELGIHPEEKEDIVSAARVHDIGKLGIPDEILLKEGELTEGEWETMEEHPVISAEVISDLEIYDNAVDVVRYEHERWDGSGYPEGLEKEEIPLGSRIVAVADVWNALRTKRPYRGPLSIEEARREIKEMSGVKLDPEAVDALLTVVKEGRAEVKS